ncbi:MAG: ABC transporter ATP-binding protein/permease [Treponema sp.]|nr:ABC transporter ATP-binding protein/permease [Treponema sp.]
MSSKFRYFKVLVSFYKPYKLLFLIVITCAAISSLAALAIPLCIRFITVEVLTLGTADAMPLIFRTLLIMLLFIIIQTFSGLFYDNKGHAMGARMERDIRNTLFKHCQRLPTRFFDREKTGVLMSRITNDLHNLAEFCHHGPENLFIFLASFIGAFIILFRIDARLTLVIFALLPLMIFYTIFFQGRLRRAYRENREKIADLNADLEDTLSGIRVVKSFTNEEREDEKFKEANEVFCQGRINIFRNEAYYYSIMEFFLAPLVTAGVVAAGGIFISGAVISTSDLIVFLLYIGYLTSPLTRIAQWVGLYQDAVAGFTRFMEIMDMEKEENLGAGKNPMHRFKGDVKFDNVSFKYGEELENVFENISLDIPAGSSVALVGASGAGKTTLCSLIPRFYELNAGRILIDGIDIRNMDLEVLRRNIGMVAQDVYLFNGTVTENIEYGKPSADKDEIIRSAKMAKAHDFIMSLPKGYDTEIGQRGIRLSGGQRQRLSIARAFLKDPPVLILDEATSALDYENERAIHESLEAFMKDRTVLIIAHRLSTVNKAGSVFHLDEHRTDADINIYS